MKKVASITLLFGLAAGLLVWLPTSSPAQTINYQFSCHPNEPCPIHAPGSDTYYSYHYDPNGNLSSIQLGTSTSSSFSYNEENPLSRIQKENSVIHSLYGSSGKKIDKAVSSQSTETYFGVIDPEVM